MFHKSASIFLLALMVAVGNTALPILLRIAMSILAVLYFWWAHGFKFGGSNLRLLGMLISFVALFWSLGGNIGFTGITGYDNQPSDYEFDPQKIRSLKKSNRVALRLTLDHTPTEEERYLKLGIQRPISLETEAQHASEWTRVHLQGLPLKIKLRKLEEWFSGSFSYSLDSTWSTLDSFLFETKQGYCQHFAYSTHELLSWAGEKSQMVYGYAGGSWNPWLRTLTYLDSDAHSWLEVWDEEFKNHRRIDPTSWVIRVTPETVGTATPPIIFQWSLLLMLLVALAAFYFLYRDPRLELARTLNTRGPISESLQTDFPDLERIRSDYEMLYFAKDLDHFWFSRFIFLIRLRIRIIGIRVRRREILRDRPSFL
ncbi:MAG: transglutaminase-like domain-containing protein [Bdellovibrionales bacterium]|nr:transglutaminase-like domain-containing protein [Bdellovibrionales bacterium]